MTRVACSLALLALAALASTLPAARELLLFARPERVEAWRLLGTQLLHPNLATAAADLGLLTLGGAFVERRSRGMWCAVLLTAALAVAASVAAAPAELRSFEGSSGLASATVSAALLAFARRGAARALFVALALLPALKASLELGGWSWSDAHLPGGARVYAPAHLAGALAGLAVVFAWRARRGAQPGA